MPFHIDTHQWIIFLLALIEIFSLCNYLVLTLLLSQQEMEGGTFDRRRRKDEIKKKPGGGGEAEGIE